MCLNTIFRLLPVELDIGATQPTPTVPHDHMSLMTYIINYIRDGGEERSAYAVRPESEADTAFEVVVTASKVVGGGGTSHNDLD